MPSRTHAAVGICAAFAISACGSSAAERSSLSSPTRADWNGSAVSPAPPPATSSAGAETLRQAINEYCSIVIAARTHTTSIPLQLELIGGIEVLQPLADDLGNPKQAMNDPKDGRLFKAFYAAWLPLTDDQAFRTADAATTRRDLNALVAYCSARH